MPGYSWTRSESTKTTAYDHLVNATHKQRTLLERAQGAIIGLLWVIGARCQGDERAEREGGKARTTLNAIEVHLDPSLKGKVGGGPEA